MSYMESSDMDWAAEQIAAAEAELEHQKQEWKVEQQQAAKRTEERMNQKRKLPDSEEDDCEDLTFINKFQVNKRHSITNKNIGRNRKKNKNSVSKRTEKWHLETKTRKKSSYGLRPHRL